MTFGWLKMCEDIYNCCDCGGNDCGCAYCWSCNACENCENDEDTCLHSKG